ncbi:MAG TPA: sulfatase [Candidatus Binatia bacterium]|nr:sulfatase [Candidatus Binatia bacterium]
MVILAILLVFAACGRDPRPDVVLVVLDTVRADHLSLYGYPRPTMPKLEAFAADAVVYRNAIAPDTWTPPSHASLFTGLAPSDHGVRYARDRPGGGVYALAGSVPTLAERLSQAGYRTAGFAGNDAYLDPLFGLDRGFARYRHVGLERAGKLVPVVSAWLRRRRGRSVFLFLNVMDAHEPYDPPPPYDRLFPGRLDRPVGRHIGTRVPDADEAAHYVSQYDGELRYVDDGLAEIFAALRATDRYENALIVVTADHGELLGDGGRWGHGGEPVRALVHVPLIVKYPGGARRGVEEQPVSLVDVAPTILAVLGLPPLAPGQPTLEQRNGAATAEHVELGVLTRASYGADGTERIERTAAPAAPHQGTLVFPEGDRRLAERLRALGYVQ